MRGTLTALAAPATRPPHAPLAATPPCAASTRSGRRLPGLSHRAGDDARVRPRCLRPSGLDVAANRLAQRRCARPRHGHLAPESVRTLADVRVRRHVHVRRRRSLGRTPSTSPVGGHGIAGGPTGHGRTAHVARCRRPRRSRGRSRPSQPAYARTRCRRRRRFAAHPRPTGRTAGRRQWHRARLAGRTHLRRSGDHRAGGRSGLHRCHRGRRSPARWSRRGVAARYPRCAPGIRRRSDGRSAVALRPNPRTVHDRGHRHALRPADRRGPADVAGHGDFRGAAARGVPARGKANGILRSRRAAAHPPQHRGEATRGDRTGRHERLRPLRTAMERHPQRR